MVAPFFQGTKNNKGVSHFQVFCFHGISWENFFLAWILSNHDFFWCMEKIFIVGFVGPKMVPIIFHHMMSYDGGGWHHMMGKGHHMMAFAHHMMGWAIIFHHMMSYDGSPCFGLFGNCCSHFQISNFFVAAACERQWEKP